MLTLYHNHFIIAIKNKKVEEERTRKIKGYKYIHKMSDTLYIYENYFDITSFFSSKYFNFSLLYDKIYLETSLS